MNDLTISILFVFALCITGYGIYNVIQGTKGFIKIYREEKKRKSK